MTKSFEAGQNELITLFEAAMPNIEAFIENVKASDNLDELEDNRDTIYNDMIMLEKLISGKKRLFGAKRRKTLNYGINKSKGFGKFGTVYIFEVDTPEKIRNVINMIRRNINKDIISDTKANLAEYILKDWEDFCNSFDA